jgi:hypothetical protein
MCEMNYTIIFQHPIALVNDLICRGSIENATCARGVLVCYVVMYVH